MLHEKLGSSLIHISTKILINIHRREILLNDLAKRKKKETTLLKNIYISYIFYFLQTISLKIADIKYIFAHVYCYT